MNITALQVKAKTGVTIAPETDADDAAIDKLTADVFGPGMFARAAYHLREGVPHVRHLSFTVKVDDNVAGSVRLTPILVSGDQILQLGPLAVSPDFKNRGMGKALMQAAIQAAREEPEIETGGLVILVGDLAYYGPFGFVQVPKKQILMPKPVDYARLLAFELEPGRLAKVSGTATSLS